MTEDEFRELAKEKGYGVVKFAEVSQVDEEMHSHEHSVLSLVLTGEATMYTEEWTKVFKAGDLHENPAGTMHREKTGPEGCSFLFAKKFD